MFAKAAFKTTQRASMSQVVGNVQIIVCDECESGKGVGSGLDWKNKVMGLADW